MSAGAPCALRRRATRSVRRRAWALAAALILVPGLLCGAAVLVPFLPLGVAWKVELAGALVVAAEVVFWAAAVLAGREGVSRYRRLFDPGAWFRGR